MTEPPSHRPAPQRPAPQRPAPEAGGTSGGSAAGAPAGGRCTPRDPALFDAILHPHRSLGPAGFLILMALVGVVSVAVGTAFVLAGAWPVFGFFGLDAALVYVAFRASYRSGRLHETVRLTRSALTVRRVSPAGAVASWSFPPNWLRVEIDDPPEHHSQLRLAAHGRALVIGSFLTPAERLDLARALTAALHRRRAAAPA